MTFIMRCYMIWVQLKYNLYLRVGEKPPIMKKVLSIDYPYNRVPGCVWQLWNVLRLRRCGGRWRGDSYGTIWIFLIQKLDCGFCILSILSYYMSWINTWLRASAVWVGVAGGVKVDWSSDTDSRARRRFLGGAACSVGEFETSARFQKTLKL